MAYVAPTVRSVGDAVTAADYNIMANDVLQFAPMVQGVFTTEAVRDAAITSPTEGMHAYISASTIAAATGATTIVPTGIQTIYNGSVWVCVTPVSARSELSGNSSSTSYVTTLTGDSTAISVTLVTGTTAKVIMGADTNPGGVQVNRVTYSISGATTQTAASNDAAGAMFQSFDGTYVLETQMSKTRIISGLTAGTNTFTLNYKTNSAIGYYNNRLLIVSGVA